MTGVQSPGPAPKYPTGPARIVSFGFRHLATLTDPRAVVIDIRHTPGIRNPWTVDGLRPLSGLDPAVQAYIKDGPGFGAAVRQILVQCDEHTGPVFIGCHGGRHRSVYLATVLGDYFHCPVTHLHLEERHT